MEARELRIGNYISYCGGPRIVELVSELKGIHAVDYLGSHKSSGVPFDFDPILTTEYWLDFFGFWPEDDRGLRVSPCCDYAYRLKDGIFFLHSEVDGSVTPIARNIKYVHQLQNIYFAHEKQEL